MITYDLQCSSGHTFEGWFESSDAFENQKSEGKLRCPVCDNEKVIRIPSVFAIKSPKAHEGSSGTNTLPPEVEKLAEEIQKRQEWAQQELEKNFENVGSDFAKEALKIHYGVSEARNIRGSSTAQEEEMLKKEGVSFAKIPVFPTENSKS